MSRSIRRLPAFLYAGATLLAAFGACPSLASAEQPPAAAVPGDTVTDYSGVRVVDPYRSLEDLKSTETQSWVGGQSTYTRRTLDRLPGLAALLERITVLDAERPPALLAVKATRDGRWFSLKRKGGESVAKLYVRDSETSADRILLDPEVWKARDGKRQVINNFSVSPDERHVAAVVSIDDAELGELRVFETTGGHGVGVPIPGVWGEIPAAWNPDGKSFYYERGANALSGEAAFGRMQIFERRLHDGPDRLVLGWEAGFGPEVRAKDWIGIDALGGGKYTIAAFGEGVSSSRRVSVATRADLERDPASAAWRPLFGAEADVRSWEAAGRWLYVQTFRGATRYRVMRHDLERQDSPPIEVVPEQGGVIGAIGAAKDALYYVVSSGSVSSLFRLPHGAPPSEAKQVDLPFAGAAQLLDADPEVPGVVLSLEGWTRDLQIVRAIGLRATVTDLVPAATDRIGADWVAEESRCTSHDGAEVPMSIVYRRGLVKDGSHPTLVDGYGGYGFAERAYFNRRMQAWFERGGIFVEVKPRGGGAFGRDWYQAGVGARKANTWKDMIACAEALVQRGYTSPGKLAIHGTSMGGVAAGRALTERPDLFAVGIVRVGITDTVRFVEASPNGLNHELEMGTVKTQQGIRQLVAMSTYAHIETGVRYPAVLFTAGMNDNRVAPWVVFKTFARLSAATASDRPVLLRVETEAGHGVSSTSAQRNSEFADRLAFILWNTGDREFQPLP